jgi:hypothetical protein
MTIKTLFFIFFACFIFNISINGQETKINLQLFVDNLIVDQHPDSLIQLIKNEKVIVLKYKKHNDFRVLWFTDSVDDDLQKQYAFRLKGYEDEWNFQPVAMNFTRYTHLKPKKYLFELVVSNNGEWNEQNKITQTIIIKPAFYQTWGFRAAIAIVKASIIIFIL